MHNVVEHLDDLSPETVADRMLSSGETVRAIAVVTAEHARVSNAVEALSAIGVPACGLISELTASCGTGYIGLDNWRVGGTAGWAIAGLSRREGRVAILVGNHRYRCQELNETGFRSYCREHAPGFSLLEPLQTFEDNIVAREVTEKLLRREPDLVGLYVSGVGMKGVLQALSGAGKGPGFIVVGHELTDHTRFGLMEGVLSTVFAHPIRRLASEAVALVLRDVAAGTPPAKRILNFEIFGPENIRGQGPGARRAMPERGSAPRIGPGIPGTRTGQIRYTRLATPWKILPCSVAVRPASRARVSPIQPGRPEPRLTTGQSPPQSTRSGPKAATA